MARNSRLQQVLSSIDAQGRGRARRPSASAGRDLDPDLAWFGALAARLFAELPLSEERLRLRFPTLRAAGQPVDLPRLVAATNRSGLQEPLAIVKLGGASIAVRRKDLPIVSGIYATAVRVTYNWGATTVGAVAAQLSAIWSTIVDGIVVSRVLVEVPGFEWLDEAKGWFWFRTRPSRMVDALAKIFSVAQSLSRARLHRVLFKGHDPRLRPPLLAVDKIAATLPGVRIEGDAVTIPARLDRAMYLSATERALVQALEPRSGPLRVQALRDIEALGSLSARAVLRLVRLSPVLEVLPAGLCCLVGAPLTASISERVPRRSRR